MIDRLTWLHISDFHFTADGDGFSQTVACDALQTDLDRRAAEFGSIAFVLVSGDIAFSGQPEEYARASDFLKGLSDRLSVEPSRFFFVPGNHDVDRSIHEFARIGALRTLTSQQEVDRALGDPIRIADLLDRQSAYFDFVAGFAPGQERVPTPDGLGYVVQLQIEPVRLAVVGLNSAWLCGADGEATSLVIGERQILAALALVREGDPNLVIALAHHPIEWLTDWEQQSCRTSLLTAAHFLHRGHMHETDVSTSPHRKCVVVAAGSAHAGRFYPNSYNLICLNLGAGVSTVSPYTYRPELRAFDPSPSIQAPCLLGGEIPGDPQDLVSAIASATAGVGEFADYMAALLLGQKDEIPVRIGDAVEFVPSRIALEGDPAQAASAAAFLGLRNLLRLHDPGSTLSDRVAEYSTLVGEFGARLRQCADADPTCRMRITHASVISPGMDFPLETRMPQTAALLEELRARQEWQLLEAQARRSVASEDPRLARLARATLAEALMHSDEGQDREEAVQLAEQLVALPDATVDDYLIACGASEVAGAIERSTHLAIEALSRWPQSEPLTTYGRGLVTRTADTALRSALGAACGGPRIDE
ncbi:MAG: metallophosphoesterase [Acidimicrobiales bacterium]